jgi:hypothetical protein
MPVSPGFLLASYHNFIYFFASRFYPSCKYGASCHFAHPQAPYHPGPLPPPVEYPSQTDGVASPMSPAGYYPPVPAPFPQSQAPVSPQATAVHSRPQSEVTSPINGPYIPNGHPGPMYGPVMHPPFPNGMPYGMHMPPPPGYMQNPPVGYPPTSPVAAIPPFHGRRESVSGYSQGVISPLHALDPTQMPRSPPMDPGMELHSQPQYIHRDPHARRNSVQRRPPSLMSKKPPCMFFPSGRCRNGLVLLTSRLLLGVLIFVMGRNDCKYPHVLPEGGVDPFTNHRRGSSMGFGPVDERMGNLRIREVSPLITSISIVSYPLICQNHSPKTNGVNGYHNGPGNGHAHRDSRYTNGKPVPAVNGVRRNGPPTPQQRLPTDDDFPVLGGSHKGSPSSTGGTPAFGFGGLTAAQVLQAPAPRKELAPQNGKVLSILFNFYCRC